MTGALTRAGVEAPRLCAEMLITHTLACERMRLYMEPDRPASHQELDRLRALTARALKHEPVQYLVGETWFFSLPFHTDQRALIPRPCTEGIVEEVIQSVRRAERRHAEARRHEEEAKRQRDEETEPEPGAPPEFASPSPAPGGGGAERSEAEGVTHAREQSEPPNSRPTSLRILDLCTGSACIAIALAKHLPSARITATDIAQDALDLARTNAERHAVADRIDFRRADLWDAIGPTDTFDFITANPPYIPDHEWDDPTMMGANVKGHEPDLALRGGPDGLALVRPIIERAVQHLAPGATLIIETAASHAAEALELARAQPGLTDQRTINDHEGHPRFLIARRRA